MLYTLLKAYFQTKYLNRFKTRTQLEEWQQRQVISHLTKILPQSKFYQRLFEGVPLESWRDIPCIDKSMMMVHFDALNTVEINQKEAFELAYEAEKSRSFTPTLRGITVGLSTGTSGNRGIFLASPNERFQWVGTLLAKILPGGLLSRETIALFLRANSNLYQTMERGRMYFHFYDLMRPFEEHIKKLLAHPPTILAAPPSILRLIAQAKMNKIPKKIISIAEVLDPLDENFLENAFQQKIHQIYQCTEGFLATTCSHGTLHLNEDIICFQKEFIAPTKFIPIITDFRRVSQPIIRYHLNDILTESSTPCPCGSIFTSLAKIEGRCDDIFYLPSLDLPTHLIPIFPDYIRGYIVDASPNILEFTVTQQSKEKIEISLKWKENNEEEKVRNSLSNLWKTMKCCPPEIAFVAYQEHSRDQKLRRVKRSFAVS